MFEIGCPRCFLYGELFSETNFTICSERFFEERCSLKICRMSSGKIFREVFRHEE
jgi:hypothetical protein